MVASKFPAAVGRSTIVTSVPRGSAGAWNAQR